jgi:DNA-binding XRE family transcriptional regulator
VTNLNNEQYEVKTTLKEVREELNISQTEAAMDLGISRSCYIRWEKDISSMTIAHLIRVCDYYGTTPNELVHTD